MALYVSSSLLHQITGVVQEEDVYHPSSGKYVRTLPGIDVQFGPGVAPSWAVEQAITNPAFVQKWNGLPDGVDFRAYVGAYDTDLEAERKRWDPETKQLVEDFLEEQPGNGTLFVRVQPPSEIADLPWPNYDDTHHFQIVKVAKEIGADLSYCLEYERKHKNRPAVIAALEAEVGDKEELVAA